ncbi:TcaA NTF2-like domain-containing protein [Pontibacillus halophilus]|nr:hypothetical protein [Pontibacillus halophilus]
MRKGTKWALWGGGALLILLVAAHFYVLSLLDPMKTVDEIGEALKHNESDKLRELIEFDSSAALNLDDYLSFLKEIGFKELYSSFEEEFQKSWSSKENERIVTDQSGNELFTITPHEHFMGLYMTYTLTAIPSKVFLYTNVDQATFTSQNASVIGEQEQETKLGNVYPGELNIQASLSSELGDIDDSRTYQIDGTAGNNVLDYSFSYTTYDLTSNEPEAFLYIQGENTGRKVASFPTLQVFDQQRDLELQARYFDEDSGEMVSKATSASTSDSGESIHLEFNKEIEEEEEKEKSEEPVKEKETIVIVQGNSGTTTTTTSTPNPTVADAEQLILRFRAAYEESLNMKDYSIVQPFLVNGSAADKELSSYLVDLQTSDYHYDFTSNTITGSWQADANTFYVSTNEHFIFTNHLNDQIAYDRDKEYKVVINNNSLQIESILIYRTDRTDL